MAHIQTKKKPKRILFFSESMEALVAEDRHDFSNSREKKKKKKKN